MRVIVLILAVSAIGLMVGCISTHKPYENNPLLSSYRPTLSDSETVLAERSVRRGPAQPPMPAFATTQSADSAGPEITKKSTTGSGVPAKTEIQPATVAPTDFRPIIRQSSARTERGTGAFDVQPFAFTELKPIVVAMPLKESIVTLPPPDAPPSTKEKLPVANESKNISPPTERRTFPGRFGRDPDYRVLQGVLEKTHRGTCFIRYCDPSEDDEFGGKFQIDDPRLGEFRDGDVVGIGGELNKDATKTNGQSRKYTIREVWSVKARGASAETQTQP